MGQKKKMEAVKRVILTDDQEDYILKWIKAQHLQQRQDSVPGCQQ